VALLSSLVLSGIPIPCGRCVGRGDVCNGFDQCSRDLTCQQSQSYASICFPAVKDGEACKVTEFDPCETGFFCNATGVAPTNICERRANAFDKGNLNDGCKTDVWCNLGFTCQSGLCKKDPIITVACTSNAHCTYGKICDATTTPGEPKCVDPPGEGAACSTTGQCAGLTSCTLNNASGVCKAYYTTEEGADCKQTEQCRPGLICDCIVDRSNCQTKCIKPTYFLLSGPGAIWGEECNPTGTGVGPGCRCNYASKTFRYLKEVSKTSLDNTGIFKSFQKCMVDAQCSAQISNGPQSCLRTKCYHIYQDAIKTVVYPDSSLVPTFCSAQGLAAMFGLLMMMLLL